MSVVALEGSITEMCVCNEGREQRTMFILSISHSDRLMLFPSFACLRIGPASLCLTLFIDEISMPSLSVLPICFAMVSLIPVSRPRDEEFRSDCIVTGIRFLFRSKRWWILIDLFLSADNSQVRTNHRVISRSVDLPRDARQRESSRIPPRLVWSRSVLPLEQTDRAENSRGRRMD